MITQKELYKAIVDGVILYCANVVFCYKCNFVMTLGNLQSNLTVNNYSITCPNCKRKTHVIWACSNIENNPLFLEQQTEELE